jgi:large subunit ribosomal protein L4
MKAPVYNLKGDKIKEVDLPDGIFAEPWNADLVHQAVLAQAANRRKPYAHTRTRGEVSGGGKKPWRQKGTGRARHGSIRSPLWKGGGVTHGPRNDKNYSVKINRKMKRKAINAVLSKRMKEHEISVIESLDLSAPKTKILYQSLRDFSVKHGSKTKTVSSLLVAHRGNASIFRASANIPKVKSTHANSLNIEDLLKYRTILIDERALREMEGSNAK